MKTLVLGGTGFIGSHIVDELLKEGHSVRIFDQSAEKFRHPLASVDYRIGDFRNPVDLAESLDNIDIVYHLISTTVPGTSNLLPVADIQSNLISSVYLLEQMVKFDLKRIVYLSSGGTVYGNPETIPIPESHPLHPICSYGVVKAAIENYLYMFQRLYKLQPVILRPSNAYGPRQSHIGVHGLINTLLHRIYDGTPIQVWGAGDTIRDYLYVKDLARLCILAGKSQVTGVYNAGSGTGCSINEIIQVATAVTGIKPKIISKSARPYDVKRVILDISRAKSSFDWSPEWDLESGVAIQWEWIKQTA